MQKDQKLVTEDGQLHIQDEEVDFSDVTIEGWISLGIFWVMGVTVLIQFLTRYVLNDSASWTEEIARYLLIATVFVGSAVGVTKNNHIQVDFFYHFMPNFLARAMATLVDAGRMLFFGAASVLTWQMMGKLEGYRMTLIDLPVNIVYAICLAGFVAMLVRSVLVARIHWQRGYSVLERPESTMSDR
jgi:TRAP-type C4-dicarboxylate transport system permease small subunit